MLTKVGLFSNLFICSGEENYSKNPISKENGEP